MKKKYIILGVFVLLIIIALLTNPTKESYARYWEKNFGEQLTLVGEDKGFVQYFKVEHSGDLPLKVEKVNFYIFSTYTAMVYIEHGVTHLGVFGKFIRISDGQFDYPRWLNLFTGTIFNKVNFSLFSKGN